MTIVDRLAAARGDAPADVALRNAMLVNVWSGEIYATDIIVHEGRIIALGSGYTAKTEIDIGGRYVCPGFIDAHVHIESSLCTPPEFARAVVPHGVTSVVTDPHEIANVLGIQGIEFMLERAKDGPLNVFVNAPSCVPATEMETSGARLEADDLAPLLNNSWVTGLAEVMNYPGVIYGDEGMLDKLDRFQSRVIDGHCPAITGKPLNAYVTAGIGSEHECTTVEEAREKLRLGLTIFIREGTTTRNLRPLLPLITPQNHTRICFCTDDRQPNSLMDEGSIDFMVRTAIAAGIDPVMAIRMGTLNTAQYFRLYDYGVIAPGKWADMVVFSNLNNLQAEMVFRRGEVVAENGAMVTPKIEPRPFKLPASVNLSVENLDLSIPASESSIRVIGGLGDQVVTNHLIQKAKIVDGKAVSDTERDILKMLVLERHHATGHIGKGFINGFGLKRGALAGTVAHDHHNLVVIGVDDTSIRTAIQAIIEMGGGLVATEGETVLGTLPLPVAGLMTEIPLEQVRREYDEMIAHAQHLGSEMPDPFMAMSFMALEVIPKLKLTDIGLVDVEQFKVVDLFI
ncbi:MAG: adenine deaminase [Chloroflexi bacterium]|nr:adenine deaminase [Chloroflexota bacterium]MCC6896411.1 adenine deaminase [Anaerolineae bacterium]